MLKQLAFYFVALCALSEAAYKKWVPNTNFDNPSNWKAGRLPCANDALKFPETIPSVFIQMNTTVHEIVLPTNGELVLSNFMVLSFPSSSDSDGSCIGQDNEFNGTTVQSWYDPTNWCEVTDPEGSCMAEPRDRLDTELVPCASDIVVFPRQSRFLVDLESGVDIKIGKIIYQGQEYSTTSFRSFLSGDAGQETFKRSGDGGATSVNIAGSVCSDLTGCPCGNNRGTLEQKVCDLQKQRCSDIWCKGPILPDGHCCNICGYIMQLSYGTGFKLDLLEQAVYGSITRDMQGSVKVMISRTSLEQIQIVVVDLDGTGQALKLVNLLEDTLKPSEGDQSTNRYRITQIEVQSSADNGPSSQTQTGSKRWGTSSIVSLVIALLAVIIVVIVAVFCFIERRKPASESRLKFNIPLHWPFRRFSSEDDRRGLEMGASIAFKDNMFFGRGRFGGAGGPSQAFEDIHGFDNPTYGGDQNMMNGQSLEGATAQTNNNETTDVSTTDVTDPTFVRKRGDTGFSNPLYVNTPQIEDLSFLDTSLRMNPIFTTEGLEEDSEI